MEVLVIGAMVMTVCVALLAIAVLSPDLGRKTCRDCGGGLPANRPAGRAEIPALGDWACPKCGTRFDRQARARDQVRT